ncbi:MAG: hypothetical protein WDN48_18315 [Pseudolabrys sp.]
MRQSRRHGARPCRHDRSRQVHAGTQRTPTRWRKPALATGHTKEVNKAALKEFLATDFWATTDDGMPRNKLEATAALMKKIGSINPDKEPVTYDALVDGSVWKDASAMVK